MIQSNFCLLLYYLFNKLGVKHLPKREVEGEEAN